MKSICVLYYIPKHTLKYEKWSDGFVSAVNYINNNCEDMELDMLNIADYKSMHEINKLKIYDFYIIKSNWNWVVDNFFRNSTTKHLKSSIMISGSTNPPKLSDMLFYNVLFYETEWYRSKIQKHPNIIHAFGVDTSVMKPREVKIEYDWISVGLNKPYKRFNLLNNYEGNGLIVSDSKVDVKNAVTHDFVSYNELSILYNKAKKCIMLSDVTGGGERCVLEARSCGLNVEIADDNPKLKELIHSNIYSHIYYAEQLKRGINSVINER